MQVTESTSELAVVHETLNLTATGLFDAVQENQYVMDRKTMLNVADDRAWAFDAANVVDRSGAYRLNFPLDNESIPYPIYLNETQTTYEAVPDSAQPTGTIEGLDVHNFKADVPYTPVTDTYLTALDGALPQPLPRELGLEQLTPLLAAAGIDIPGLLPALLPALNEADRTAILALAQQPVKLQYLLRNVGEDSVEVSTGGIVEVRNVEQNFAAAPDPALVPQLDRSARSLHAGRRGAGGAREPGQAGRRADQDLRQQVHPDPGVGGRDRRQRARPARSEEHGRGHDPARAAHRRHRRRPRGLRAVPLLAEAAEVRRRAGATRPVRRPRWPTDRDRMVQWSPRPPLEDPPT